MGKKFGKVLCIDLSEEKHEVLEEDKLFEAYIGGSGVAIKLLLKECPKNIDPLSPENPIILAPGPFGGLFPSAGKTVAAFKSPLTGNLGETHAGGRLALCMKLAGYDAIIIKEAAKKPIIIKIDGDNVKFCDASPLKGFSSLEVERRIRACSEVARIQSILSIGCAGENKILYACVNVDRYNYFGRLGLGAVFGAKNLKAISIVGSGSLKPFNIELYKKVFKKIYKEEVETDKLAKYHFTGTPANVLVLNELKALPTKNFQQATFECAEAICGETLGEKWLDRKVSCPLCPIGCMHIARLRPAFASGYEYAPIDVYYNYESVYALGSNLLIKTAEEVLMLIQKANFLGVDTMLMGSVLAWATEAFERGLINKNHTIGLAPKWSNTETYLAMMDHIALKSNEFYDILSQGVEKASAVYGGEDFAMVLCGNGLAGYHTGYASLVGTIVGARHSHNSNAGYDIDQKVLHQSFKPDYIINELINENEWRYVLTSLVICLFARRVYTEKIVCEALKSLGIERSPDELRKLGGKIYRDAFDFKFREGFNFNKIKIPKRSFETPTANGKIDESLLRDMLARYMEKYFKETSK